MVTVQGNSNAVNDPDFEVKTGKVIWHQFDLDVSKWDEKTVDFDFKEMEIKKAHLLDICDMYKTIWFGHQRLLELTGQRLCVMRRQVSRTAQWYLSSVRRTALYPKERF